jgi:transcriptional regulator with XRE-family HTH domain
MTGRLPQHADQSMSEEISEARPAVRNGRGSAKSLTAALGGRIRALRLERGLSLRTVASAAQVSPSLLSQIERGEASPSLVSLVAIADALVVRPGVLLEDGADGEASASPVVRREQRRVIDDEQCRREYLMHLDDPYLEVAELIVAPGGHSRPQLARHSGRDYGVVTQGELVVEFEGRSERLRRGDYIAFEAELPHRIVNQSAKTARVLWIIAHPRSGPDEPRRPLPVQ